MDIKKKYIVAMNPLVINGVNPKGSIVELTEKEARRFGIGTYLIEVAEKPSITKVEKITEPKIKMVKRKSTKQVTNRTKKIKNK